MSYYTLLGLSREPFSTSPDPGFFYDSAEHHAALVRLMIEIRLKRGLAYEVGVHHEPSIDYGFFSVYLNTDKKNISKCVNIILKELNNLKDLSSKGLSDAKGHLEGQFILDNEDTQDRAEELGFWATVKDAKLFDNYLYQLVRAHV